MSILNGTSRIKAYRNYIKRTLIILRYRYLKTLIGLYLWDLNNYSNTMEYGSLIRRVSQYYKHCTTSLTSITVRNGQIKKLSYILTMKDPLICMPLTVVFNYVHLLLPLGYPNYLLHLHLRKLCPYKLRPHKLRLRELRLQKLCLRKL